MAREQLAGTIAVAIALPLAAVFFPVSPAAAAPVTPGSGAPADIRTGTNAPNRIDGKPFTVPDRYTPKPRLKADTLSATGVTPAVGTVRQWVGSDDLSGFYRKDYTLRGVGLHVEVWVANDLAFPVGDCRNAVPDSTTVSDAQVAELIDQFDNNMYPKETAAFSTPPDRDGSNSLLKPDANGNGGVYTGGGDKTVTLVDNIRDDNFYTFPAVPTYIAGFFSSALTEVLDRNTMTIDAFDWTHRTTANPLDAPTTDLCTSRPARPWLYEGVFAHEWQHLLHYYTDPFEATWLNEGLSDFAIALDGYSNSTASVFEPAPDSHIYCFQGYGPVQTQYNPNPRDCGGPQNSLNLWGEGGNANGVLADYGNAFSFMLFLYDRYGLDFMSKLHQDGDPTGVRQPGRGAGDRWRARHVLGAARLPDHDPGGQTRGGLQARRHAVGRAEGAGHDEEPQLLGQAGQPAVLQRSRGRAQRRGLRAAAAGRAGGARTRPAFDRLQRRQDPADPAPGLDGRQQRPGPGRQPGAVLRQRATTLTPPWSPRLRCRPSTRRLRFLAKYGAEQGYDYGYVSVSTDGGTTYTTIPGDRTTDGPLGSGLNGTTTGFEPRAFDLSAYAGQNILISIRYVSDGGVNEGGLLLDDLTVGSTTISDGSSLDPFDSPTEIKPDRGAQLEPAPHRHGRGPARGVPGRVQRGELGQPQPGQPATGRVESFPEGRRGGRVRRADRAGPAVRPVHLDRERRGATWRRDFLTATRTGRPPSNQMVGARSVTARQSRVRKVVGANGVISSARPVRTFCGPGRVGEQRAANGHQVELVPGQPLQQLADAGRGRHFATEGADELGVQADRADRDHGTAGDLLDPAGEVEVRAGELRLPVTAGGGVEHVDTRRGQRGEDVFQFLRVRGELVVS